MKYLIYTLIVLIAACSSEPETTGNSPDQGLDMRDSVTRDTGILDAATPDAATPDAATTDADVPDSDSEQDMQTAATRTHRSGAPSSQVAAAYGRP